MPDLIIMPKSRSFQWHFHQQDNQIHNAMTLLQPTMMNEAIDFSQDLQEIVGMWDEQLYGTMIGSPRMAFWSLDELRQWVRDQAASDVYVNQHTSNTQGLYACSTDEGTIKRLTERSYQPKNHKVRVRMDALLVDSVTAWIKENCADKTETVRGWPKDGSLENDYSFRSLDDATLFTVRWKGHGALEIL